MPSSVFIVDDNRADIELLRLAFEEHQPSSIVHDAASAREALKALSDLHTVRQTPNLALIDLHLTGDDSWRIFAALQTAEFRPRHLVAMSGAQPSRAMLDRLSDNGIRTCLVKPASFGGYGPFIASLSPFATAMALAVADWCHVRL